MISLKKRKNSVATEATVARKTRRSRGLAGISLFVFLLDKLSDAIHNMLVNGFFGRIFSSYQSELSAYENGYFVDYFRGNSKTRLFFKKLRAYVSRNFEESVILKWIRRTVCGLATLQIKAYGSFFTAFGIYTMIVYFIKRFLPVTGVADTEYLYVGICICLATLPLCFTRQTLAKAVKHSKIMGELFITAFGFRDDAFENHTNGKSKKNSLAVLWGLFAGILTFFIHPLTIIISIAIFAVLALIVVSPEIGILISIFSLPFLSFMPNATVVLTAMVIITTVSYIIKLIRGKRIFRLELVDFAVLLFMIIAFISGTITVGGMPSYYSALVSCVLLFGYFLIVNLIRTEAWINRCIYAIVVPGVTVAIIGVIQYLLGYAKNDWIDKTYFADISGRATALFENPNYLAAYLAIVFPFALYLTFNVKGKREFALCAVSDVFIILCAIFTWSRGAWLAMIICAVMLCMMYNRKTYRFIWIIIASIPFLPFILPNNVINRFMSIGDMADSSTMYRVYTWKGSLKMAKDYFLGGIGYGTEAFAEVYPIYAYAGIEAATHSHNLYLQILIGMGLGGILSFALILFLYAQKTFSFFCETSDRRSFMISAAALISVFAMLIMGMFDYVWYNYRIFFMFWITMAIGIACIKIATSKRSDNRYDAEHDENTATYDIDI